MTAADARGRRIFVFLFDENHLSNESLSRVKAGAERFLATQFGEGDVGGVYVERRDVSRTTLHEQGGAARGHSLGDAHASTRAAICSWRSVRFPPVPSEADAIRITTAIDGCSMT